jgi:hypothetical protein
VFRTLVEPAATSFQLRWPHTHAAAVIDAWQAWAPGATDDLFASLLLDAAGDLDQPPVVTVMGAMLGSESDTAEQLDELVALAGVDPASAVAKHMSYRETKRYLAELGDQEQRVGGRRAVSHRNRVSCSSSRTSSDDRSRPTPSRRW